MAKGIPSKRKKFHKHGKHAGTKNLGLQIEKLKGSKKPLILDPVLFHEYRKKRKLGHN